MSICLADFSAVKIELDNLDEQIFQQTRRLRQLRAQNENQSNSISDFWTQNFLEQSSIARLDCEIADREAALEVYKTILGDAEQAEEAKKVLHLCSSSE